MIGIAVCVSVLGALLASASAEWKQPEYFLDKAGFPVEPSYPGSIAAQYQPAQTIVSGHEDQCGLYKVGFVQDLYFQYVQYKTGIPEMNQFTLCMWNKFTNHSNDHPLFSYAVDGQPRAIFSWVSNTERSSYYSMSVNGHTFYRLNYPLRLNRWYHSCQSWNGKTGEWQIWVNAERVGRGFHNRLVGHNIPAGGIAISGQEQTQIGGGFQEGAEAPKGSGGMLGEVTMVQLYKVALTAGKAHKDHKHHHVHHFDHDGQPITTQAPPTPAFNPNQPTHPLLTGGQINPTLNLNLAGAQQQPQPQPQPQLVPGLLPNGQEYNAQLVNGQFIGNLVAQQFLSGSPAVPQATQPQFQLVPRENRPQTFQNQPQSQIPINPKQITLSATPVPVSGLVHPSLVNPANVQFIDTVIPAHQIYKRDEMKVENKRPVKRQTAEAKAKRELVFAGGAIVDDALLGYEDVYTGLAGISDNQPVIKQQQTKDEREPAEAEVMAVMNVCGGCDEEPFAKALIFGWRTVPKKLYSGAFYTPAVPQCRLF